MTIEQLKETAQFIEDQNIWLQKSDNPTSKLAIRFSENEAFVVENPGQDCVDFCLDNLKMDDAYSFLYLEINSGNRIHIYRRAKAEYWSTYFSQNELLQGYAGQVYTLKAITKRFLEHTLFDGRTPELRSFRKENWYDFNSPKAERYTEDPMYLSPLENIGLWTPAFTRVEVLIEDNWQWRYEYFNQFFKQEPVQPNAKHQLLFDKLVHIKGFNAETAICYPNSVKISVLSVKELKDFSYMIWENYIHHFYFNKRTSKQEYTTILNTDFLRISLKGYDKIEFKNIIDFACSYDFSNLLVARPMRLKEVKNKTFKLFIEENELFLNEYEHPIEKQEFLQWVDNWMD